MRPTEESKMKHRARRDLIEARDKKLIRLRKRLDILYRAEREFPLIELPQPIQKGFKKEFVLRSDIARRRDANDFKRILGAINNTVYCKNEDFKVKKWHSNQMEDVPHNLKHIPEKKWDKLGWPEHFKKWFVFQERPFKGKYSTFMVKGYWFAYPWMFVTEVSPNMYTHVRQIDINIKKEQDEINKFFEHNNGWDRLNHLQGYRHYWDKKDHELSIKAHEEYLREEMAEYEDNYLDKPDI